MLKEFKEFALKGNVIDLAVALVMGAAFTAIVSSLVADVITPLILKPALEAANVKDLENLTWGTVKYGKFIAAIINFIVIAFILFMIIKGINKFMRKTTPPPAATPEDIILLREIRDALKK